MWSCAAPGTFLRSGDLAAACIQADAALKAGTVQAAAATTAGYMTLIAGLLAIVAAIIGAGVTLWSVRRQIRHAQELQEASQRYAAKKDAYLNAAGAFSVGLFAISRLGDVRMPVQEALSPFFAEAPKIAQLHAVAPLAVLEAALNVSAHLSAAMMTLTDRRRAMGTGVMLDKAQHAAWGRACTAMLPELAGVAAKANLAMRSDLGLPIDAKLYEKLVATINADAVKRANESFAKMMQEAKADPFATP